jgi:OOP family OmpA-OmpF porin
VVVVTDGVPNEPVYGGPAEPVLEAARTIVAKSDGPVCFHTVLAGDDVDQGRALLESLASVTDCGSFRYSNTLTDSTSLAAFERSVFVTEAPPAVAAPRPADADRDGVVDASDACPGTPVGAQVDDRGCWVLKGVRFASNSTEMVGGGAAAISSVATVLEKNPKMRLEIGGHTDSAGAAAYNQDLSERRAKAVKSALVERGIDASRLDTRGYGEEDPVADNATAEGRAENRRIEFTVER